MRNTLSAISLSALMFITLTDCMNRQGDASTSGIIERPNFLSFFVDDLGPFTNNEESFKQ